MRYNWMMRSAEFCEFFASIGFSGEGLRTTLKAVQIQSILVVVRIHSYWLLLSSVDSSHILRMKHGF